MDFHLESLFETGVDEMSWDDVVSVIIRTGGEWVGWGGGGCLLLPCVTLVLDFASFVGTRSNG